MLNRGHAKHSITFYKDLNRITHVRFFLFGCFYPCEVYLSHIPVPARRKDKKKRTAARRPHAGRTSIRDVIVMLQLRHHVAFQRIQTFLEVFFMFCEIFSGEQEKESIICVRWDRKICPSRSSFVINRQVL